MAKNTEDTNVKAETLEKLAIFKTRWRNESF